MAGGSAVLLCGKYFDLRLLILHIEGHLDVGWPRPPAAHRPHRLADHLRNVVRHRRARRVPANRPRHGERVGELMKIPALALELGERILPTEHEHWRRLRVRHAHAGERIGETGSRHDETGGDFPRSARTPGRHQRRALLVPDRDHAHRIVVQNSVEQRVVVRADDAEYVIDAFDLERRRHRLTTSHTLH
jgi:hypothetical protein